MSYKDKYLKYRNKYLALKGGFTPATMWIDVYRFKIMNYPSVSTGQISFGPIEKSTDLNGFIKPTSVLPEIIDNSYYSADYIKSTSSKYYSFYKDNPAKRDKKNLIEYIEIDSLKKNINHCSYILKTNLENFKFTSK